MSEACTGYIYTVSLMPQFEHMGGRLVLQSFILIGGDVAKWATLTEDTCMARLTMKCEMQGNAVARVTVE